MHAIAMRAKLAGVDEAIRSDELALNLTCKGPPPSSDGGGGCSASALRPSSQPSLALAAFLFALFFFVRRAD